MPCAKVIVLAGGHSVQSYNLKGLEKRGYLIGVNESFLKFPACHAGITMDRLWMEARVDQIIDSGRPFFTRHATLKNIRPKVEAATNIQAFKCEETHRMSENPEQINGTSSGMCGLNFALQLKPEVIYLLGFDMGRPRGRPYWYHPYEWVSKNGGTKDGRFRVWCDQFQELSSRLKPEQKVINVNHMSALKCFPTISYAEFLNETR